MKLLQQNIPEQHFLFSWQPDLRFGFIWRSVISMILKYVRL